MNRREFIESSAAAAGAVMFTWADGFAAQGASPPIGIQVGAISFLDEGTPEDVYQAVKATFEGGAHGIILSRKYSEMRLDNLRAAGRAIREVVKRTA